MSSGRIFGVWSAVGVVLSIGCAVSEPTFDLVHLPSSCFDVQVGEWEPYIADRVGDSLSRSLPSRVRFLDEAVDRRDPVWMTIETVPGALPSIFPRPTWTTEGDSVIAVWGNGYWGVRAGVHPTPRGLDGTAHTFTDDSRPIEQSAPIHLMLTPCDAPLLVTVNDQRQLPDSVAFDDGTVIRLGEPPPVDWGVAVDGRSSVEVGRDLTFAGLGSPDSLIVETGRRGRVVEVTLVFGEEVDFDRAVETISESAGAPQWYDRLPRETSGLRSARWSNRSLSISLQQPKFLSDNLVELRVGTYR